MCNCGCNTCETKTKGPLLTEGKVKSLLSEGLQYHIDKQIPLFETVYRIGSNKHLALVNDARKLYSRNIIDLCDKETENPHMKQIKTDRHRITVDYHQFIKELKHQISKSI